MATLADLIAQREKLDVQIQETSAATRADAVTTIRALMEENGLTVADLRVGKGENGASKRAGKSGAPTGKKVAAKYRDGAGNSWSGRGLQPRWLKSALAEGKTLKDFEV